MTGLLTRTMSAAAVEAFTNDPAVHEQWWEPTDWSRAIDNPANYALLGEHGGMLFIRRGDGQPDYTMIIFARPSGRGGWIIEAANEALAWMFTNTDAQTLTGTIHKDNHACLGLLRFVPGGIFQEGSMAPNSVLTVYTLPAWCRANGIDQAFLLLTKPSGA